MEQFPIKPFTLPKCGGFVEKPRIRVKAWREPKTLWTFSYPWGKSSTWIGASEFFLLR